MRWDDRAQKVDDSAEGFFNLEYGYQVIYRMLVDPELGNPEKRIFNSATQCRTKLSPNEAQHFLDEHERLQREEFADWHNEASDPMLRRIALLLGLAQTASPDEIVSAAEAKLA